MPMSIRLARIRRKTGDQGSCGRQWWPNVIHCNHVPCQAFRQRLLACSGVDLISSLGTGDCVVCSGACCGHDNKANVHGTVGCDKQVGNIVCSLRE